MRQKMCPKSLLLFAQRNGGETHLFRNFNLQLLINYTYIHTYMYIQYVYRTLLHYKSDLSNEKKLKYAIFCIFFAFALVGTKLKLCKLDKT